MKLLDRFNAWRKPSKVKITEDAFKAQSDKLEKVTVQAQTWKAKNKMLLESILDKSSGANAYKRMNAIAAIYGRTLREKQSVILEVNRHRENYLYTAIKDIIVSDTIAPSTSSNDILKLSSKKKDIDKKLKELESRVDLDGLCVSIVDELIDYGEYFLKPVIEKGKGVTALEDSVNQQDVVAIYTGNPPIPESFLTIKKEKFRTEITKVEKEEYVHFALGQRKLRVEVDGDTAKEYVRIGRPLFYGTFELINSLSLMSALIPASYMQKINGTSIIGVSVPEGTPPEDAFTICREYEALLNMQTSVDTSTGQVAVADVLNAVGKYKAVPIYGGEKGSMQKVDPRFEDSADTALLEDFRKSVCATVGVPYTFLFGADGGNTKGESLKTFARYVRKLVTIQSSLANGLKQVALMHLRSQGIVAKYGDIDVTFTNNLISVEDLDRIEFADVLISTIANTVERFADMAERLAGTIDGKKLGNFIDRYLMVVGLDGCIKMPKKIEGDEIEPVGEPDPDLELEKKVKDSK